MLALSPAAYAAGVGTVSPKPGELDVVLRHDGDGSGSDPNAESLVLLQRLGSVWQTPVNIGGSVHKDSEIVATPTGSGSFMIAVRWADNSIRVREWTASGGWGAWLTRGTDATGGPALTRYGASGDVALAWRNSSGTIQLRHRGGGTWAPYSGALSTQGLAAGVAPALIPSGAGIEAQYLSSVSNTPLQTWWDGTGAPESEDLWTDPEFSYGTSAGVKRTITSGGAGRFIGGDANRHVVQLLPGTGGASGTTIDMGGTVAGSPATSRPGESTIPNTPGSALAYETTTSTTPRYELFWREDNGCIATRTSATLTPLASWSAATEPKAPVSGRCAWPAIAPTPTISAVSPSTGSAAGGTQVTLTGTNLGTIDTVRFGTTPATRILSQSATKLIVVSPAGTAGPADVSVTNTTSALTSANTAADDYTYAAVATGVLKFAPQYWTAATILKNSSVTGPSTDLNQWSNEHEASDPVTGAKLTSRAQVVTGSAVPDGINPAEKPWGALQVTNKTGERTDLGDGDPKPRAEVFTDRDDPDDHSQPTKRWKAGDTAWIDFWINVPDMTKFTRSGANADDYWSVIYQWKGGTGSPVVALEINPVNGNLKIRSNQYRTAAGAFVDKNLGTITSNKWQRVTLGVHFSDSATGTDPGTIDATFDGATITQIKAQTIGAGPIYTSGFPNTTVYAKEGLYQAGVWTDEADRTMFHSPIRIATTKELAQQR